MNLFLLNLKNASGQWQAVIEIPAGTNRKTEINKENGSFCTSLRNGQPRIIDFLPYPVNYGFIPGTLMDKDRGGDGDPLDVLLICESRPVGTVMGFVPVAVLYLTDSGEQDAKIIAIPADPAMRTICATNFQELTEWYQPVMDILVSWFLNYDRKNDQTLFKSWGDETTAVQEIEKWTRGG